MITTVGRQLWSNCQLCNGESGSFVPAIMSLSLPLTLTLSLSPSFPQRKGESLRTHHRHHCSTCEDMDGSQTSKPCQHTCNHTPRALLLSNDCVYKHSPFCEYKTSNCTRWLMQDSMHACMLSRSLQLGIILCEILNNYLPPQTPKALWKPYSAIDKLFLLFCVRLRVKGLNHMFEACTKVCTCVHDMCTVCI